LRGEERFGKFGPTELTLIITGSGVVMLVWPAPMVSLAGFDLRWFDLVAVVVVVSATIELVRSLLLLVRELPGPVVSRR
jgi:hypothetical protein